MKKSAWILSVAAVVLVCGMGQWGRAAQSSYRVYVSSSQATAGDASRILTYDPDGNLEWSKGLFATEGNNLLGLALHTNDLIYTTAWDGKWILRYERTAGEYAGGYNYTGFGNLGDVTMGPNGNIYFIISGGGVRKMNGLTGADLGVFVAWDADGMRGLAFGPDANLYIITNTKIKYHNGTTGAYIGDFATGANFARMTWHNGDAYVADKGSNAGGWPTLDGSVLRFQSNGTPLGAFVAAGSGGLQNPEGLVFTPDNKLLVCDYYPDHIVRRYNGTTGAYIDDFATPPDAGWCRSIAVGTVVSNDYFSYVCGPQATTGGAQADRVFSFDPAGNLAWDSNDPDTTPVDYRGVAVSPDNQYVYVMKRETGAYYIFNRATGAYVKKVNVGANFPTDVTFGPDGNMYVILKSGVWKFTDPYVGSTLAPFASTNNQVNMQSMAWGPDTNLYVAGGTIVGKYNGSTGAWMGQFFSGGVALSGLTWHNGDLYVAEKGSNGGGWPTLDGEIRRIDGDGTVLSSLVAAGTGGLQNPEGIAFTPGGRHLLVCDYYPEYVVRRYSAYTGKHADNFIFPPDDCWPRDIDIWEIPPRGTIIMVQ